MQIKSCIYYKNSVLQFPFAINTDFICFKDSYIKILAVANVLAIFKLSLKIKYEILSLKHK